APARATALSDWLVCLGLPKPCAGEPAGASQCYKREPRDRGKYPRIGVTRDGADNAPRPRVANGEDSKESKPPLKRRVKTHTASPQHSSTPVPWRWRSRGARIRGLQGTSPESLPRAPRRSFSLVLLGAHSLLPGPLPCRTGC